MNLRPPGPQPGALPDCATPRESSLRERATGIEPALEAWKASVQPQHFARKRDQGYLRSRGGRCWRAALLGGDLAARRRSSGRRRPRAEPVVGAPSRVTTEPLSARPSGPASSATSQPNSSIVPQALQRDAARGAPPHDLGVLAQRLGVEAPDAPRRRRAMPRSAHSAASSRVSASTAARAAPVCAIAGMPWCGETVTLTTVPPSGAERRRRPRRGSSCRCRRRSAAARRASPWPRSPRRARSTGRRRC